MRRVDAFGVIKHTLMIVDWTEGLYSCFAFSLGHLCSNHVKPVLQTLMYFTVELVCFLLGKFGILERGLQYVMSEWL